MATGSQWDLVQVVAWGRMFTGYSAEMSLTAAAKKTFSGELCTLCHVAQDGRKQQESGGDTAPPGKQSGKMLDLCPLAVFTAVISPRDGAVGSPGRTRHDRWPRARLPAESAAARLTRT